MIFLYTDYESDDHYDYIGAEYETTRNQPLSTLNSGVVENPYYEGSNNMMSLNTSSPDQGHGQETQTITITQNLYYEYCIASYLE